MDLGTILRPFCVYEIGFVRNGCLMTVESLSILCAVKILLYCQVSAECGAKLKKKNLLGRYFPIHTVVKFWNPEFGNRGEKGLDSGLSRKKEQLA